MPETPRRYWLVKSEPETFSFDDLAKRPKSTTHWDGVRNYQARNFMREMRKGDKVFFYHSNAEPPHVAGVAEVAREAYPDHSAFDLNSPYHDAKSKEDAPTWFMVDIKAVEKLKQPVSLAELREMKGLEKMTLTQKGSRLSVQPVTADEWDIIYAHGMTKAR